MSTLRRVLETIGIAVSAFGLGTYAKAGHWDLASTLYFMACSIALVTVGFHARMNAAGEWMNKNRESFRRDTISDMKKIIAEMPCEQCGHVHTMPGATNEELH